MTIMTTTTMREFKKPQNLTQYKTEARMTFHWPDFAHRSSGCVDAHLALRTKTNSRANRHTPTPWFQVRAGGENKVGSVGDPKALAAKMNVAPPNMTTTCKHIAHSVDTSTSSAKSR